MDNSSTAYLRSLLWLGVGEKKTFHIMFYLQYWTKECHSIMLLTCGDPHSELGSNIVTN